jgi:hypothetical protein
MRVRLPIVDSRHNDQFADVIASFVGFTLTSQTRGLSTSTQTCHGISLTTRLTTETQRLGVTSTLQLMVQATSAGINQNPAMNPIKYGIAAIFEPSHCQIATTTSSTFETLICQVLGGRLPKKFNTSAGLQFEGGHPYYIYGDQTAAFVSEIIGPEPEKCNKGPGLGIDAFKRRVNNVATGMTNA